MRGLPRREAVAITITWDLSSSRGVGAQSLGGRANERRIQHTARPGGEGDGDVGGLDGRDQIRMAEAGIVDDR